MRCWMPRLRSDGLELPVFHKFRFQNSGIYGLLDPRFHSFDFNTEFSLPSSRVVGKGR